MNQETILYALSFLGVPYKWGGSNPISGIDCSGLAQEILAASGLDKPGDQNAQAIYDNLLPISHSGVMGPGAFCFYGSDTEHIIHVTYAVNQFQCVGANGGGSNTLTQHDADKTNAFVKLRPVDYRKDLVAILMPKYK